MARQLTQEEISTLAARKGVRGIAVRNFLGSMPLDIDWYGNYRNMLADARCYQWTAATQNAIKTGLDVAFKGKKLRIVDLTPEGDTTQAEKDREASR